MIIAMSQPSDLLGLYLHLARASALRRQPHARDRLLVISGVIATHIGLMSVAAYCRQSILEHNPGHMVRRWNNFADALEDSDFLHFLKQVQRRYPQEKAERMLSTLGIDMAQERQTYYNDTEYAAALLGVSTDTLDELFGSAVSN